MDTLASPAGRCTYEGAAGNRYFNGLKVKPPTAYYPDLTPGHNDHGVISWKVKLQNSTGGWHNVKTSSETFRPASQTTAAVFTAKKVKWPGPFNDGCWRARVVITWYTSGANTIGKARIQIDKYFRTWNSTVGSSCKGHTVAF